MSSLAQDGAGARIVAVTCLVAKGGDGVERDGTLGKGGHADDVAQPLGSEEGAVVHELAVADLGFGEGFGYRVQSGGAGAVALAQGRHLIGGLAQALGQQVAVFRRMNVQSGVLELERQPGREAGAHHETP